MLVGWKPSFTKSKALRLGALYILDGALTSKANKAVGLVGNSESSASLSLRTGKTFSKWKVPSTESHLFLGSL